MHWLAPACWHQAACHSISAPRVTPKWQRAGSWGRTSPVGPAAIEMGRFAETWGVLRKNGAPPQGRWGVAHPLPLLPTGSSEASSPALRAAKLKSRESCTGSKGWRRSRESWPWGTVRGRRMPSAAGRGQGPERDRRPENGEQPAADVGLRREGERRGWEALWPPCWGCRAPKGGKESARPSAGPA